MEVSQNGEAGLHAVGEDDAFIGLKMMDGPFQDGALVVGGDLLRMDDPQGGFPLDGRDVRDDIADFYVGQRLPSPIPDADDDLHFRDASLFHGHRGHLLHDDDRAAEDEVQDDEDDDDGDDDDQGPVILCHGHPHLPGGVKLHVPDLVALAVL